MLKPPLPSFSLMGFQTTALVSSALGSAAFLGAAAAGLGAAAAPLAWLRYEMDDASVAGLPTLRLTLWRGGAPDDHLLAHAHPHGSFVQWHG